jgi:outer membrane biosynthesis protein TonB
LRDHSHTYDQDSDVCSHCGQPLPPSGPRYGVSYGRKGPNRLGLAGTIALHLLLVAIWFFDPEQDQQKTARPAADSDSNVVYVAPLKEPTREQLAQPTPRPLPAPPVPRVEQERIVIERLPDTITVPDERPAPPAPPQPQRQQPTEVPPDMDMAAYVKAQRERRGAPTGSEVQTEESEAARGTRNALANIAAINGRGRDDSNETGGIFSVSNKTFNTMDLKFRGWNPSFKRRWLTAVTVEQGSERDIETAVIKKMIELIRREKTGDFEWDSHRLGRVVKLSARPQDTERLTEFLYKEMFPEYRPMPAR